MTLKVPSARRAFDGENYEASRDYVRLAEQTQRVFDLMKDGRWRTLPQIEARTGDPQASVSARLRDLRKSKFGGHTVEREYVSDGLYRYRLVVAQGVRAA